MPEKKIKITFILPSLSAGGAERIMSFIAQELNQDIFETTLLVIGFEKDSVYNTGKTNTIFLNKKRVLHGTIGLFNYFRKAKPDIVLSSIVHLNTLTAFLSVFFHKTKFIAREANVLSELIKYNHYTKVYFPKFLTVFAYKLIDCIICQSKDMKADMAKTYNIPERKLVLINNPITSDLKPKLKSRNSMHLLSIITVGRLSKEKGYERIIEVLSKLNFPFNYTMIGDGIERENLMLLIKENNLKHNTKHIPYTKNVNNYLKKSDLFLQGSYVEGFPNVLLESCVVGTPVVAFNAPGGLDEIIESNVNGYIVNNVEDCVDYLNNLYTNFYFKPELVSQVVNSRFNKKTILKQYESLFVNIFKNAS
ncbi:glycosyltransferase [Yeosuana sp. MJ-SS3]|uniref:Glycosyltransferase n=1 Tax=Gilvirhabdus luticola TaxID=3079858 RepID=A0ABU3U6X4_9FLAO|nr:glycosyltransferase [Yeosuana sp. MJ-SS3]MDU8886146.1 glycosyltransferase [Yeosuana sp. MJ-SS3]